MASRARKNGIEFDPDISDIVVPEVCPILGIPLLRVGRIKTDQSPSLDRYCPSLGYVRGNRWVISSKANTMKSNATLEEMVLLGKWAQGELDKE